MLNYFEKNMVHISWQKFVDGDNQCIDVIFKEFHQMMLFTAYYYVKSEDVAKDVVSDVFRKMLEMSPEKRMEQLSSVNEKLEIFLKVLVKNKSLETLRTNKNRNRILNGMFSFSNHSLNIDVFANADFEEMLDLLPTQQRNILEMSLQGYKHEEICEKYQISYSTCRNTLSTSKKKIRSIWKVFMD